MYTFLISFSLFLLQPIRVEANHFNNPPPEVHPYGFPDNKNYTVGDTMLVAWDTSWNPISMVLWQWRNPANEIILDRVPNLNHFQWTISTKQDLTHVSQFCLQISDSKTNAITFTSRYFNILPPGGTVVQDPQVGNMSQPASWAPVATTTDPGASATSAPTDVTKLQSVAISGASQPTGYQSTVPSSQNISAQKKHTNRKLAIGLGVGLAVGVAALAFLIALFAWRLGQREDPRLSCAELNGSSSRPISELPHELPLPTIRFELADPAVSGPPGPDTRHELCAGIVESSEKIDWI